MMALWCTCLRGRGEGWRFDGEHWVHPNCGKPAKWVFEKKHNPILSEYELEALEEEEEWERNEKLVEE